MSRAPYFFTTMFDVINTHLCPYLSLGDRFRLALTNSALYKRLHQKNLALYVMRQIWSTPFLSRKDKIETVFKTGVLDCIKYLLEETNWIVEMVPYMTICCEKGHEKPLSLLLSRIDPVNVNAEEVHKTFINVVWLLAKSGHLELAWRFFSNEQNNWPATYFGMFNNQDRFTCWKYAVQHGLFELEERMPPLFVQPEERERLPGTRLLLAIESLNIQIFDVYWNRMEFNRQERRDIAMHARLEMAIHHMIEAPNRAKREAMAAHIGRCLSLDAN